MTAIRMAIVKKSTNAGEDVEKGEFSFALYNIKTEPCLGLMWKALSLGSSLDWEYSLIEMN